MIEPVVFPFTYLDPKTANILLSCFNQIRVYIPTDSARAAFDPDLLSSGQVTLCNPVPDSGHAVDQAFEAYRQWRQANMGTDISFFKSPGSGIPFFDETTISYLRQDIVDSVSGTPDEPADMLLAARVFLRMTENFDRVQTEIEEALFTQDAKKLSMLAALHGNDEDGEREEPAAADGSALDEAGELMTTERLTAWSRLAAEDDRLSAVYVTSGNAVLTAVSDRFEDASVIRINIPVFRGQTADAQWKSNLSDFMENLVQGKHPLSEKGLPPELSADPTGPVLTIIHLAAVPPRIFLSRISDKPIKNSTITENAAASTIVATVFPA
jgi:hypothetical protein